MEIELKRLKALSDAGRFKIFSLLMKASPNPKIMVYVPVKAIKSATGMEPTLLSHHLAILKQAGLAVSKRDGKCVSYAMAKGVVDKGVIVLGGVKLRK